MTEEGIFIDQLIKGDTLAFRKLMETYRDKVINASFGIVQNQEDAEDIAQEVFVEIYHSITYFKKDSRLSTWIYRITVNKSLDLLRSRKRKKRMATLTHLLGIDVHETMLAQKTYLHPDIQLEEKERYQAFTAALDKIPESQRIAFTLHKFENLSYLEIAEVMNLSLSSVESLIHRAKQNLQKRLLHFYHEKN